MRDPVVDGADPGSAPCRLTDRAGRWVTEPDEDPMTNDLIEAHHPYDAGVSTTIRRATIARAEPLLAPIGPDVVTTSLDELRERCRADVDRLDPGVRRLVNPHVYHVSLSDRVWRTQQTTIARARSARPESAGHG
ncbi:MAG: hypothetical protein R2705_01955 [Ilumatobacteraceae bacterium]